MWLEINALLGAVSIIFISIVLSQIILLNMMFGFLLIVGIFLIVFSNIIIGYQITRNHLNVLIDPVPPNHEVCVLFDFSGNIDFLVAKKAPLGKREFIKYKEEASVINNGDYQIRFINGNHGFIGHENYGQNVNLYKTEALGKMKGDDIKEIVDNLPLVHRDIKNDRIPNKRIIQ